MTVIFQRSGQLSVFMVTIAIMMMVFIVLRQGIVQDLSDSVLLQIYDFSSTRSECSCCGIICDLREWELEAGCSSNDAAGE